MYIVGLHGKKRSGKDYSSLLIDDILTKEFYVFYDTNIVSFAEPLYEYISKVFNVSVEELKSEYKLGYKYLDLDMTSYERVRCQTKALLREAMYPDNCVEANSLNADIAKYFAQSSFKINFRDMMQQIGTDCFKKYFPNIWIKLLENKLRDDKYVLNIVSDIRFVDEYDFVNQYKDNLILHVVNTAIDSEEDKHSSEQPLNECCKMMRVNNNYDESLRLSLREILLDHYLKILD